MPGEASAASDEASTALGDASAAALPQKDRAKSDKPRAERAKADESKTDESKTDNSNADDEPSASGQAAASDAARRGAPVEWALDELELRDGSTYRGMLLDDADHELEFAEIFRRPGKPMFAVVRPIPADQVVRKTLLRGDERVRLAARFQQFRNRAQIEAGRMEDVELRRSNDVEPPRWLYEGPWFRLESTADEAMVRRCVVRTEQIFRAYRQLLPSARRDGAGLRLLIFGSHDEYQRHLARHGLTLTSPAWFSQTQNTVVAGGELNAFSRRAREAQAQNDETRRQYKALKAAFPQRLATLIQQMKDRDYAAAQIEQEVKLRSAAWQREYDEAMTRLDQAAVQNEAARARVTDRMFAQLYHEAFHAYVENYVCIDADTTLPAWLNEGLAQVCESGQIEAEGLRIDAPDRRRLAELQRDLRGAQPLALAELVRADAQRFLNAASDRTAQRYYLYAWGLAYYVTFEGNRWQPGVIQAFLKNADDVEPGARLAQLVAMPIDQFEPLWRAAILAMK